MTGRLLVVAWPNSDAVVSSFRKASGYVTPPVYSNDSISMSTIESGTFVNSTHFSYTFLCSGCITGDILTFSSTTASSVFGWAYSSTSVVTPSDASSDLSYHTAGFGEFGMTLTSAESALYSTWAALASAISTITSGSNSTTTSTSNSTVAASTASSTATSSSSTNITATVSNTTYDYIIAGGGPAGIIVAERIAETGASVLLIERGAASTYASGGRSVVSWNDTITQYDVPALGYYLTTANDTSEYCTDTASMAGCILGGSTMINALMFVRPQEIDFDDKWPTGWKWADVSSSADSFYKMNPGTINPSSDGVRYDQGAYTVLSQFFSGNGWSSVDALEEPNKKTDVFSHPPWNIQDGLRAGPVMTYLPQAQSYSNFHLELNTKVIRAVRTGSTITGVEVETSTGERQIINVNDGGKVILASGALSTPRLLFNSGIGPAAQIQTVASGSVSVTLPEEADWISLPVGEGVKDHPIVTLKFNTTTTLDSLATTAFTSPNLTSTDLFAQGNGVLVEAGQRLNFWSSVNSSDGTRFFQGTCNSPASNTIQMKIYLTHGLTSSGVLGITSAGATEFTTDPWLNTDADKEALSTFIDRILAYTRTANSTLSLISTTTNATGADLIANYVSGSHFVGSAKMGSDDGRTDNGTSVVDLDTKVYGTDNLFVVDASMHPDLPTGNTQAIVMVAAEAAAKKILALNTNSTVASTTKAVVSSAVAAATSVSAAAVATSSAPYVNGTESSSALAVSSAVVLSSSAVAATGSAVASSYAAPTTLATSVQATGASSAASAATPTSSTVNIYGQCGGATYSGPTTCVGGTTCKVQNDYYSQCIAN